MQTVRKGGTGNERYSGRIRGLQCGRRADLRCRRLRAGLRAAPEQPQRSRGICRLRVARREDDDQYIVVSRWRNEDAFKAWRSGEHFAKAHGGPPKPEGERPTGSETQTFTVVLSEPAPTLSVRHTYASQWRCNLTVKRSAGEAFAETGPLGPPYPIDARVNDAGHLEIGGCDVLEVAQQFGTPSYVYAAGDLRSRARAAVTAFREAEQQVRRRQRRRARRALCQQVVPVHGRLPTDGSRRHLLRRRIRRRVAPGPEGRVRPRAHPHARQQQDRRRT